MKSVHNQGQAASLGADVTMQGIDSQGILLPFPFHDIVVSIQAYLSPVVEMYFTWVSLHAAISTPDVPIFERENFGH